VENAIYWQGRQVGLEVNGRTTWFPSAPREAIDAYAEPNPDHAASRQSAADAHIASNLMKGA
jgi:hypothetical protein